jgi:NADPH-dependent curcumin reductase CurA
MPQDASTNRRILLAARPHGLPTAQDFRLDHAPLPSPGDGEVLLRTLYLSLDPYMRNLMDEGGTEYAPGLELGQPMMGGTVSRVVSSRHAGFHPGELVLASVLQKRIRMQGFVILDHYADRFAAFRSDMQAWLDAGRITLREDRVEGLEHAPAAFIGLLEGRNFGKLVVRVADD